MTDKQQPEALRRADDLESEFAQGRISNHTGRKAATELRRLHAESEMRRAALLDEMRKAARLHAENETLRAGYAAARLEIESLRGQLRGWVSLPGELPKSGMVVLACYRNSLGNLRRIRAQWIAAKTDECTGDDGCLGEYDADTDTYWTPEGWYELIDNWDDYMACAVSQGDVTHWMPLPAGPAEGETK